MSIFDHPDHVPPAASWRCPHCHTLQAETTHCWRCDRGAVACATCHHFRTSVASDLGYCATDGSRTPLTGEEVRSCWQAAPVASEAAGLFTDPMPEASPATPPLPATASPPTRRRSPARPAKPPLEEPRAAAWTEDPVDELVDAPPVPPGRQVTTEIQRRRRWWRR